MQHTHRRKATELTNTAKEGEKADSDSLGWGGAFLHGAIPMDGDPDRNGTTGEPPDTCCHASLRLRFAMGKCRPPTRVPGLAVGLPFGVLQFFVAKLPTQKNTERRKIKRKADAGSNCGRPVERMRPPQHPRAPATMLCEPILEEINHRETHTAPRRRVSQHCVGGVGVVVFWVVFFLWFCAVVGVTLKTTHATKICNTTNHQPACCIPFYGILPTGGSRRGTLRGPLLTAGAGSLGSR